MMLSSIDNITQSLKSNIKNITSAPVPSLLTTKTTTDFVPKMNLLNSLDQFDTDDGAEKIVPTLAETVLENTSTELKEKNIKFVEKEFSNLTIHEIYNNTIKTIISIINDFSELISEKETISSTEFRRRMVESFFMKERRMYVGIILVLFSFILYFIDSSV